MFHQQDEMVSSYLFSFREASCPLFWISEFCLHSYLTPLKCQQNLGQQQSAFLASDILERAGQRNSIENAKNPSYEYSLSKEFQKAQQYEGRISPTPHLML